MLAIANAIDALHFRKVCNKFGPLWPFGTVSASLMALCTIFILYIGIGAQPIPLFLSTVSPWDFHIYIICPAHNISQKLLQKNRTKYCFVPHARNQLPANLGGYQETRQSGAAVASWDRPLSEYCVLHLPCHMEGPKTRPSPNAIQLSTSSWFETKEKSSLVTSALGAFGIDLSTATTSSPNRLSDALTPAILQKKSRTITCSLEVTPGCGTCAPSHSLLAPISLGCPL